MEHQKISNLSNEANYYKSVIRKWNIVNDHSEVNYEEGNETTYNTEVLKSNLCDDNNAYILVSGDITVTAASVRQAPVTHLKIVHHLPYVLQQMMKRQ